MNEQQKKTILERYKKEKEKGVPFFPDILFKDAVVSLVVFLILVALAYFVGAPLEERANPSDANYTPRPEWYFLFLFQLLKYFPGELEVVGVVLLPTLAILGLFILPFVDKKMDRHFSSRPFYIGFTAFVFIVIIGLTVQANREIPPPLETSAGDPIAILYTENCAGCHGLTIKVSEGTNLHDVITQGSHEGMPAWTADLTTDEVDALAGFILSPAGNDIFHNNCAGCHEISDLVATDPLELKNALAEGRSYTPHEGAEVQEWPEILSREERTALLNFLVAPDGQRLFATNCAACHGRAISFAGEEAELRDLIAEGGLHLEMPPWQEKLSSQEIDDLAVFVLDPGSAPQTQALFDQHCSNCHGDRVPTSDSLDVAREVIATGGSHETMPVWGEILTDEQLDALTIYTLSAASGAPFQLGQELYSDNCSSCHGAFGEGGENPSRPDDIIAPISTAEYLKTRDNFTLQQVISQGQPNFGMSPFGSAFGGLLEDDEINAIVDYIRAWQDDPPVELPPEVVYEGDLALDGGEIFASLCYQCHGPNASGVLLAPSLGDPEFQADYSDQDIFDAINLGHEATTMIAWGEILTSGQITELVEFIRNLPPDEPGSTGISFSRDVMPILESRCSSCHGSDGGWDAATYDSVINSGDNGPVVIPGDVENSLLAQKLQGTQDEGDKMPPVLNLSSKKIQVILDWIAAGAPNN